MFCLVPWHGEADRPGVVTQPDGRADSRIDQVCLDIPPAWYQADLEFWSTFTGWPLVTAGSPEFHRINPPPALPIQLLLQRLDSERPASAHLDLACTDVDAATAWHESCGARRLERFPHWQVLRDPAGGVYCLTGRDPHAGRVLTT